MTEVRDTDKGWGRLVKMAQRSHQVVRVGIQGDEAMAPHADDEPTGDTRDKDSADEGEALTNVRLAIIHEFGVPEVNIRERSFIRATLDENAEKYIQLAKDLQRSVIDGKRTIEQALGLLGARIRADIVARIDDGRVTPDISEETKRRKGSTKPLLDHGEMKNSVTYVVGRRR